MDIDKMSKQMDEWFKSPQADEYFARKNREDDRQTIWVEKVNTLQDTLNDDELVTLMTKFINWESKYQYMYHKRYIDTHSAILGILFEFVREYGTNIENDEMFPTESHEFRGYVFNLTHGQGSILWIKYEGQRIL
jgi:hypothetical protein